MDRLASQPRSSLLTTAITRGELLYGVLLLPQGQRKHGLLAAVQAILDIDMAGRVLSSTTVPLTLMRRSLRPEGSPADPSASSTP